MALLGCSSGLSADGPGSSATGKDGQKASPTDKPTLSDDPDQAVIDAVDATLAARSFSVSSVADLNVGPQQFGLTTSGAVDYEQVVVDVAIAVESGAQQDELEIRSNGTTVWIRVEGATAAEVGLPPGIRWIEGDADKLAELGSYDQTGLIGVVLTLRAADNTELVGTDTIDGIDVTRFRTTVIYQDAVTAAGPDAEALQQSLSLRAPVPVELDIDVAVGSDGIIRDFSLIADTQANGLTLSADYQVDLTRVGEEVSPPEAPPTDETLTGPRADAIFEALAQ